MSQNRKRWNEKASRRPGYCPHCREAKFRMTEPVFTGRPQFHCDHCGSTWTCGNDGGEHLRELVELGVVTREDAEKAIREYARRMG